MGWGGDLGCDLGSGFCDLSAGDGHGHGHGGQLLFQVFFFFKNNPEAKILESFSTFRLLYNRLFMHVRTYARTHARTRAR